MPTQEKIAEFLEEYRKSVKDVLEDSLPSKLDLRPAAPTLPELPGGARLPLEQLANVRRDHETQMAKKAVRTSCTAREQEDELKARQVLVKKVIETLKLQQDQGIGTGLVRIVRWNSSEKTGNAANAAAAASARSTNVSVH